jgi:antitoxin Phd
MASWQLQNAKTHLSELIEDSYTKGPQIITRHGAERAVVVSMDEYRQMEKARQPKSRLMQVLLHEGPKFDDGDNPFENVRDQQDFGRDIDLDDHAA